MRVDEINFVTTSDELPKMSLGTEIAIHDGYEDYKKQRPHRIIGEVTLSTASNCAGRVLSFRSQNGTGKIT